MSKRKKRATRGAITKKDEAQLQKMIKYTVAITVVVLVLLYFVFTKS